MKKLLSLLGAIGLVATSSATVVACGPEPTNGDNGDDTDTTKGIDVTSTYVEAGTPETGVQTIKDKVLAQLSDEQKATADVKFYDEGTTISLSEDQTAVEAKDADGNAAVEVAEFHSAKNYVYAITLTTTVEEVATVSYIHGNVTVDAAQQIVPQEVTDLHIQLTNGDSQLGAWTLSVENPGLVGTLSTSIDDTKNPNDFISVQKDTTNEVFNILAKNVTSEDVQLTISSDLSDVEDVTISITVIAKDA